MAGYICWSGESRIDGNPVVLIITGVGPKSQRSRNEKTGGMVQSWLLRSDINPIEAISQGEDRSICGNCPMRGVIEEKDDGTTTNRLRSCYVGVDKAPLAVYNAYKKGKYQELTPDIKWPEQSTRCGSYGDLAAVPFSVVKDLISRGNGKYTGYSHQNADRRFAPMRKFLMASVHSEEEARELQSQGWRTFRTMNEGDELMPNELMCPASEEEGKRLTCEECMACSGIGLSKSRQNAASVAIRVHGSPSKLSSYSKTFEV